MSKKPILPVATSVLVQHIQPLTTNQDLLLRAIKAYPLVVAVGSAGTGKTYCAVNAAVNELASSKRRKKLVFTRTNVPTGRSLGFMPGTVQEKLEPWLQPMLSELRKRIGPGAYESWLHTGRLEMLPLETVRGRSFEDTIVLVDEAQNLTVAEIQSLVTRIGEDSKMILTGDLAQRDTVNSGLIWLLDLVTKHSIDVPLVLFELDDIVRSDIVASLVRAMSQGSEDLYSNYRYYRWQPSTAYH